MKADLATATELCKRHRGRDGYDLDALERAVSSLPNNRQTAVRAGIGKFADRQMREIAQRKAALLREREELPNKIAELTSLFDDWLVKPFILEQPGGSCVHHIRQSLREQRAFIMNGKKSRAGDFDEALAVANCFVFEHDWAKAFDGATDFADGDIRLPYEVCAFDLKISGRRVVALMTADADSSDVFMQVMVRGKEYWLIDDDICRHHSGKWAPIGGGSLAKDNAFQLLTEFIGAQVRAVTIALDAQVAESAVVRVNEKLARSRERSGHVPPNSYHIVSLARRSRVPALPSTGEPGSRKRLHFRRGHWRHYEDHKTWIRWMLVGDPDLGFVDKEYRL